MKHSKAVGLALMLAVGIALPMQAVQAAEPAEVCGKALIKALDTIFKNVGKALGGGCKGRSPADIDEKLTAKVNKAIDKLNSTNDKVDCATNQDPDNTTVYPVPDQAPGTFQTLAEQGERLCNGVDDP